MNNDEFVLRSYNRTFQRRSLIVVLSKCKNSTELGSPIWKPDSEIDQIAPSTFLNVLIKNNYFDFNNFVSPVNQFLQREDIQLDSDTHKLLYLNVKKNDYVLRDSLSQFTQEEDSFYSFNDI